MRNMSEVQQVILSPQMPFRSEFANKEHRRRFTILGEPILRINVKPSGIFKIDALMRKDEDRTEIFDFYMSLLADIRTLDTAIRNKNMLAVAQQTKA
jgi:hypothetical protein